MSCLAMPDGTKIYHESRGDDEAILFVHGLNSSHFELREFIDEFKSDHRCIAYDQRGHGASDRPKIHLNVRTLGQDMNELIECLDLRDLTVIGHSMGAAALFSYIDQFGCDRLKRVVAVDMSPYMRNGVWSGGIAQGQWTDEDFLEDMDRIFDDVGRSNRHITKTMPAPELSKVPSALESFMISACGAGCDRFHSRACQRRLLSRKRFSEHDAPHSDGSAESGRRARKKFL